MTYTCLPCKEGRHFDCINNDFDNLENPCTCENDKKHFKRKKKSLKGKVTCVYGISELERTR